MDLKLNNGWPVVNGSCRCPLDIIQTHSTLAQHENLEKELRFDEAPSKDDRKILNKLDAGPHRDKSIKHFLN